MQSLIARFMGPTRILSAPDGPHVGPMTFAIWDAGMRCIIVANLVQVMHSHYYGDLWEKALISRKVWKWKCNPCILQSPYFLQNQLTFMQTLKLKFIVHSQCVFRIFPIILRIILFQTLSWLEWWNRRVIIGSVFYIWWSKVTANERRRYICKGISHRLRTYSAIVKKRPKDKRLYISDMHHCMVAAFLHTKFSISFCKDRIFLFCFKCHRNLLPVS